MPRTERQEPVLKYKFGYTAIIITVYFLGRNIPLCGVDLASYAAVSGNAQTLLMQSMGGDEKLCSLFVLGLSPLMVSSILVQLAAAVRNAGAGARMSPGRMRHGQIALTVLFALIQAVNRAQTLRFEAGDCGSVLTKTVAVIEMVTGAMIILWLSDRNRKYGFGGQTIIIYVNIMDRVLRTITGHSLRALLLPLMMSGVMAVVSLIMEGGEKRLPMQRISIYNVYADKNYLAIKMNPVGVMPVMFSTAFFMLPQMAAGGLRRLFPEHGGIAWWQENLTLTRPAGIGVYLIILYVLIIGFSMVMISPWGMAEQFLKGGDSIMNLHAGRETCRYLMWQVWGVGSFSAAVMSLCLGGPMVLQLKGGIDRELVMFPSSVMMLTSLWYSLYQEFKTLKSFEAYGPFI